MPELVLYGIRLLPTGIATTLSNEWRTLEPGVGEDPPPGGGAGPGLGLLEYRRLQIPRGGGDLRPAGG